MTADNIFPSDELSRDNDDHGHNLFGAMLNYRYYLAPIRAPKHVADLGTGRGKWALGLAGIMEPYNTQVLGLDENPTQVTEYHPNATFERQNIEISWDRDPREAKFDLVYIRLLFGVIRDWPAVYANAFECVTVRLLSSCQLTFAETWPQVAILSKLTSS